MQNDIEQPHWRDRNNDFHRWMTKNGKELPSWWYTRQSCFGPMFCGEESCPEMGPYVRNDRPDLCCSLVLADDETQEQIPWGVMVDDMSRSRPYRRDEVGQNITPHLLASGHRVDQEGHCHDCP